MRSSRIVFIAAFTLIPAALANTRYAQNMPRGPVAITSAVEQADPTARVDAPVLESSVHKPLPEQFIWLAMPAGTSAKTDEATPRYFRTGFDLTSVPREATLYVSGPEHIRAFVNGKPAASGDRDPKAKTYPLVVIAGVATALQPGRNVIAIEGTGGSPLAVKIVPAAEEVNAPAILISGPGWKVTLNKKQGWESPTYDDSSWQDAKALGSIDTRVDGYRQWYVVTSNLEWNSDSEMYRWPGYDGISPYLAHLPITATGVSDVASGAGGFTNVDALTKADLSSEFEVTLPTRYTPIGPSLILDFGRETNGRLEVTSDSDDAMRVSLQYGESREEAITSPYLGTDDVVVPPHTTVYGPKSAFRYVKLNFLEGISPLRFKSIRVDAIYYPVRYLGSFESSDQMLNRIWAVGAYTAHLCMQDAIWDAPKRDRMPWMGDLDVSGHVIDAAFADHFLMQNTMDRLIDEAGDPLKRDVNGIPGYSAFWVMGEADYYRHIGDIKYLRSLHDRLVRLLDYMTGELDDGYFANTRKAWPFVDWSPGFDKDTVQARAATQFEFYKAFSDGAWMLEQMGDSSAAEKYQSRAEAIRKAAQSKALDPSTDTFGDRWQENAMAIYAGAADAKETAAIWQHVLSQPSKFMISPYYNFYVISAMADAGHRRETLDWIRKYWGGMINEGATSFWEGYDPSWPKTDFHAHLQADDGAGYYVSLAHGWSSGPTVWLTEEILGVRPIQPGFREASIRPDLAGLEWARGSVPTPSGVINVNYEARSAGLEARINLPSGITARVSMPVCSGQKPLLVDGRAARGQTAESGARVQVQLDGGQEYHLNCGGAE
ncbi:MAG TPA: alpha-L-rhamnosidase C-terminal domain-containing protein [Candidatus Acidoferrum sp.]|nr:alpha-L-rhamnosidase C-terminal domain-containing protein [Candidatus Acidoferrum sp.]